MKQSLLREKYIEEKDNAMEGVFWSHKKRLKALEELYQLYWKLTPYPYKPLVKSFDSFEEYENWKTKQKNPYYW